MSESFNNLIEEIDTVSFNPFETPRNFLDIFPLDIMVFLSEHRFSREKLELQYFLWFALIFRWDI